MFFVFTGRDPFLYPSSLQIYCSSPAGFLRPIQKPVRPIEARPVHGTTSASVGVSSSILLQVSFSAANHLRPEDFLTLNKRRPVGFCDLPVGSICKSYSVSTRQASLANSIDSFGTFPNDGEAWII